MAERKNGLPELSVKRPMLVAVLNLLIIIAGIAAIFGIEVRELPDVDRPIVSVRATLPGGAPETIDAEVTSVLEGAVARVSGVREIRSSSEENSGRMRVEFSPGTDLNIAAADVREAVSRVTRELPDRVENVFVTKADDDADPIMTIAVISDSLREDDITQIIDKEIAPEILSVDGVAAVQEYGTRIRQMRVVINPSRLSRFGYTISDVADALSSAPFDVPVGSFRSNDQELIVRAEATTATPQRIKDVTIDGNVKVGDVADVMLAPADASNLLRLDGEPVIGLGIVRQAQSNTIRISDAVTDKVEELNARYDTLDIFVTSEDAVFIRTSVTGVITSLFMTIGIVVLTMWVFLGSVRATIVPAVTIPVALIGTIAGIWAMGFSINLLTLLALVLATGLIVDDAIVVLENIQRKQDDGVKPRAAAAIGARQVFFAVVSTTAVLVAVFVPISFLPSTAGRLFREFGFVLAFAVIISSFVALTLGPAISAKLDFQKKGSSPGWFASLGQRLQSLYEKILGQCLRFGWVTLGICLIAAAGAALVYNTLDSELVPPEDRGQVEVFATGPDGVGLTYMDRQADQIESNLRPLQEAGVIQSVYTIVGRYDPNRVGVTARLVPWSERDMSQQEVIEALQPSMDNIPGARVSVFGRGSLSVGGGNRSGLEVALTGGDYSTIYDAARALSDAIETQSDILSNPDISYQPTQPQLSIQIDRQRAADLNVDLDEISLTLRAMVGGEDIVDLNVQDEAIPIILEAQTSAIRSPTDLSNLFVRNENGSLIPLSSLTRIVEEGVAAELDRFEQRRAIEVEMDIAAGTALADGVAEIQRLADDVLPSGINMLLQGDAELLRESTRDLIITFTFALVIVFLVMVAQFESLTSPVVIMLIVPFGIAAAVYALFLTGVSLNIYSQIGFILLIGLMAKNGILLVEFADQLRGEGYSPHDAALEAASIRMRPIVMTVISTALGAIPLILASGAGSEARQSIGWVIFGGLGLAAAFTLFLAPVFYMGLARFSQSRASQEKLLDEELQDETVQANSRKEV